MDKGVGAVRVSLGGCFEGGRELSGKMGGGF